MTLGRGALRLAELLEADGGWLQPELLGDLLGVKAASVLRTARRYLIPRGVVEMRTVEVNNDTKPSMTKHVAELRFLEWPAPVPEGICEGCRVRPLPVKLNKRGRRIHTFRMCSHCKRQVERV